MAKAAKRTTSARTCRCASRGNAGIRRVEALTRLLAFFLGCAPLLENLGGGRHAVERSREPRIDGHLHDDLDNLFARAPDVQRTVNVHLELRPGRAQRR